MTASNFLLRVGGKVSYWPHKPEKRDSISRPASILKKGNMPRQFMCGDKVYFLSEYHWLPGTICTNPKPGTKSLSIEYSWFGKNATTRVSVDKVAFPDEVVCIVWELSKNYNRYRVERDAYPEVRVPAKDIGRTHVESKGRVDE